MVFKYLGRLLAQDDDDIQAIRAQLRKARATWARVGQVLRAENAPPRVAAKFYKVPGWKATLCCDNLRALQLSSQERRRIKPSAACSDLHRSLCSTKNIFTGCFEYLAVDVRLVTNDLVVSLPYFL